MAPETKISLQVGTELRIRNNGDTADATLIYRFDEKAGEHILRLLDPS